MQRYKLITKQKSVWEMSPLTERTRSSIILLNIFSPDRQKIATECWINLYLPDYFWVWTSLPMLIPMFSLGNILNASVHFPLSHLYLGECVWMLLWVFQALYSYRLKFSTDNLDSLCNLFLLNSHIKIILLSWILYFPNLLTKVWVVFHYFYLFSPSYL